MLELIVASLVVIISAGFVVKYLTPIIFPHKEITNQEFRAGIIIVVPITVVVLSFIGYAIARNDKLSKNEYWGGWETSANHNSTTCAKDGWCHYTYECEPYYVDVPYESCSGSGEDEVCTTKYRKETRYHQCPYVTNETNYSVSTTIGDFSIATNRLPENPEMNRWTDTFDYEGWIPNWIIQEAGTGIPPFWQEVKDRTDYGKPGPVTKMNVYQNFIQAAEDTSLTPYDADVEEYLNDGILPRLTAASREIAWPYFANKVYFVGYAPSDPSIWYDTVARFNAALGNDLQGDLHLVIVQHDKANTDPQRYLNALLAYWQNEEYFGDDTFAKNGVLVIAGTDGQEVQWLRAGTGVPGFNGIMIETFVTKRNIDLDPKILVGDLRGEFYNRPEDGKLKVKTVHGNGLIEDIIFGLSNPETQYQRVSMTANDENDVGTGFKWYQVKIDPGQKLLIVVFNFLAGLAYWALCAYADLSEIFDLIYTKIFNR